MEFVNPRRHRIFTLKDSTPPAGEELRIIRTLDHVAFNREGTAPAAEMVFLPGKPAPVRVGRALVPGDGTQGFSGKTHRSSHGLGLNRAFPAPSWTQLVPCRRPRT